jgi:hypothetical protein
MDRMKPLEIFENLALAAASGVVAIISQGTNEELWRSIAQLGLPLIKVSQLTGGPSKSFGDAARSAWSAANALKLQARRGRINRGYAADLLFFEHDANAKAADAVDWKKLQRVMVAGDVVWENGKRAGSSTGILLRRT